jgi:SAM-dependent methyltransferase
MFWDKLIAQQLCRPSGLVGQLILGPVWNKRNAALNDVTFDHLALNPHDRVLEVGFGGGYLLSRMSTVVTEGFLAGVDVSPAMVARCEKRFASLVQAGQLELKCARAESLPYPNEHFTQVCTVNSIFYWQNVPQALAEFWRVLRDNGLLVMCFTCKASLEKRGFAKHGVAAYDAEDIRQMIEAARFHDICIRLNSDRHRAFVCLTGQKRTRA